MHTYIPTKPTIMLPNAPLPLSPSLPTPSHTPTCRTQPPNSTPLQRRVLACDLDGTLLTTSKLIHPVNTSTILDALHHGLLFLPATGKSPSGAFRAMSTLGTHLLRHNLTHGVFLNGLLVHRCGDVIHEAFLSESAVEAVVKYAERRRAVALFYRKNSVFVETRNELTDLFIPSHEPVPTEIGSFARLGRVNKALLLHPTCQVGRLRGELEHVLRGKAVITQARKDVLEVMPEGVNKATGLELLLGELGFAKEDVVAVGDNENDVEMIRMAGLGVAVGNAVPRLREVADRVVATCDDAGVAQVLREFVL